MAMTKENFKYWKGVADEDQREHNLRLMNFNDPDAVTAAYNGMFGRYSTGENDVDAGINRVGEYFKQGKIKVFNTCKHLIWELERYHVLRS